MKQKEIIVISLGGSLIVPQQIDIRFLKDFKSFIEAQTRALNARFFIIAGGGRTARLYRDAAAAVAKLTPDDLDWLGIHSTRLNGHLLRTIFRQVAHPRIITDPLRDPLPRSHDVVIAAGWRPGWSTDFVATKLAERVGARRLLNLSNIHVVHDRDPKQYKKTKRFSRMTWSQFRALVGSRWDPGMNTPFDPVASRLAQRLGLEVIIMYGKDFENVQRWLVENRGKGTVIV
ncbi:MAG: hypothetical protein A3B74_00115 [Candidatus Kerfeldbacteria bacterium RIFCSPHIGHO2_02_FULL_42_14]|uniref:UMP kinase n=1 Tax=Candidatus Kerfeldbacteria bacterium RIFCSPHIGHO2_02_FULL_42_14 TaxID=1798540 RepID=A0A1G2ARX8_9BACT|nr:MAG: hypothetical protein A3B74_00115 [Candidatus Kerfeldbacteria bacterium RIFCSPHIGHO2_02_FULL_42_14]OGY81319.1 MAG: hypothetical protein A3E60_02625 [Candidatus Kerfeldbacteria bacterium RIFCSPHIGHO2_12_FULL_42_13]OGY83593.1 MAG: hypothetical protein A3I91_03055 [Candidatus Kerfeldbacteria bacterium RIFCSPLOWO2_02_FULL_42_19]OGY86693.1 MAG: hypothetical protein A3G01_00570 [Candidatus Kerfeldbacteria bacterium RIFCSPLOWO2_12_FULL_43_9]